MNTLYDTANNSLRIGGKLLRIRVERAAERNDGTQKSSGARSTGRDAVLTFKGPPQRSGKAPVGRRYKIREEREVHVADAQALEVILKALGFRPAFRYEKYRSTYRLRRVDAVTLVLDETPIGDFLEAEGNPVAIDRVAALLGYEPADYITKTYGQLFLEMKRSRGRGSRSIPGRRPGLESRDMLFVTSK